MAFRAFFALPAEGFQTSTGVYTNAVYGFTSMLLKLIETHSPTHVAVAFDLPGGTFRSQEYAEYKAGRAKTPEEFKGQIGLIQELLTAMGITFITKENFEADDILATLASQGHQEEWRVLVASGDRDSFQMVTDNVTVIYPGASTADLRLMTPEAVEAKYGVPPGRYPELAALVGESADNLPGVPGVGPKTAAQWLVKYDGLDNLLVQADSIGGKRGMALREHIDDVRRNRRLNHLLTDLDVGYALTDLTRSPVDRGAVGQLCDRLEFNTLRQRIFALDKPMPSTEGLSQAVGVSGSPFTDEVYGEVLPDAPMDVTPSIRQLDVVAFSVEALQKACANSAEPCAIFVDGSFAPGRADAVAVVFAVGSQAFVVEPEGLDATDETGVAEFLRTHRVLVHDGKAVAHALGARGWRMAEPIFDTQLAAYVLNPEQRDYSVASVAEKYLGVVPDELSSSEQVLFSLEGDGVGIFADAVQGAGLILDLYPVLCARLEETDAVSLVEQVELPVQSALVLMEQAGIAIDSTRLESMSSQLGADVDEARRRAWDIIGEEVNLSSPKQLQVVLFETLGLPKTKKTKTGYTTNAEALVKLYEHTGHPFVEQLLIHRDRIKLKQMVESLRSAVLDDSRIHSSFSQVTAATGRLASSDPNLQNIPARTDEGRKIRHAFVPGVGFESLMSADYSQIEMRIMAHLSGDEGLIEAFHLGEDLHRTMAAMVFGVPVEEVSAEQRSRIKATSYGLAYGLSAYGLSVQLGISVGEATALRDRYFDRFAGVQSYLRSVVERARRDGFTQTMFGRRRYLPDLNSANRQRREIAERAALNAPIQGSAADIVKIAMVSVNEALLSAGLSSRVLLQVHDELVVEVAGGEEARVRELVREGMSSAADLLVPLDVAIGVGKSWMEAAH